MKYLLVMVAALAASCALPDWASLEQKAVLEDPASTPEQREEVAAQVEEDTAEQIVASTAPFIPAPFQPLLAALTPLLVGLAFKRSREHIVNAGAKTAQLDVGGAIVSLARAFGLKHTTEDPDQLARTAEMLRAKAEAKAKVQA